MGDIYRRFAALAGPLMELDLPDPAGREVIQAVARRARRLDRMAELIPALRVGAEQGKFVELSEKLQGDTGKLVAALDRGGSGQGRSGVGGCMAILRFLSQTFSGWRVCRKIGETDELLELSS